MSERRFKYSASPVRRESLTALLTCVGAQVETGDAEYIALRQNPFRQKRGGLSFGAYASIRIPDGRTQMTNINVYNKQARLSPLTLSITDYEKGTYALSEGSEIVAGGRILEAPAWATQKLASGRYALEVLQRHGPANLVGVIGEGRCSLFVQGNPCAFCTMNGGTGNTDRTAEELAEAFDIACAMDRRAYNITVTTGLQYSEEKTTELIRSVAKLKSLIGSASLALVVAPFADKSRAVLTSLKEAGVDTLMMPLDCASEDAQQEYLPGKARLLGSVYWENIQTAVEIFGKGNVTSSIIVGLEDTAYAESAIQKMADLGVVPEPIPVRWDDSLLLEKTSVPITDPDALVAMRDVAGTALSKLSGFGEVKAGCSACGGCSGFKANEVIRLQAAD